jgi:hypothetical protein
MTCSGWKASNGGIIQNDTLVRNQSWFFKCSVTVVAQGAQNMTDRVSPIEVETSRMSTGNCNFMVRLRHNHSQRGVSEFLKYCTTKSNVLLSCDLKAYGTFYQTCHMFYTARTEIAQLVRRLRYGMDSRRIVVGFPPRVEEVSLVQSFKTASGAHRRLYSVSTRE